MSIRISKASFDVLADNLKLVSVVGLSLPSERPQQHLFDWTLDGLRPPSYFRWVLQPVFGDLLVGSVHRHSNLISGNCSQWPVVSWLRGFWFGQEELLAMRPFFCPLSTYDDFDAVLNERVTQRALALFQAQLPPSFKNYLRADNKWLSDLGGSSW